MPSLDNRKKQGIWELIWEGVLTCQECGITTTTSRTARDIITKRKYGDRVDRTKARKIAKEAICKAWSTSCCGGKSKEAELRNDGIPRLQECWKGRARKLNKEVAAKTKKAEATLQEIHRRLERLRAQKHKMVTT